MHALIHAGFVYLFTQSLLLFTVEFIAHFAIDKAKVNQLIGFTADQFLHILFKFGYVGVMFYV